MNDPLGRGADPGFDLVASDLDGTLLDGTSAVAARTASAMQAIVAAGSEFVIATGRSHWSMRPIIAPVGCVRWAICSNGATVYDFEAEAVVAHRPLPDEHAQVVVEAVTEVFPSVGLSWESPSGIWHTDRWVENRLATDGRFVGRKTRESRELEIGAEPILKLMLAHDVLTELDWLDALSPHLPTTLSCSTSGATFVEVTRHDANKGAALAALCTELGVARERTIAFGDHSNDLEMLEWVGTGYAMANADERIHRVADEAAPPHHEHGVAQVLEQHLQG